MTELVVALLMIINGEIKEHRIQIDPKTGKPSMSMCLKGKRYAKRTEKWSKEYKGKLAETPMDAAKDCDFIFTCVGNDNDLS